MERGSVCNNNRRERGLIYERERKREHKRRKRKIVFF